jgi:hypothetical protein
MLQIHYFFYWTQYFIFAVDEVEQILSELVQISGVSLPFDKIKSNT